MRPAHPLVLALVVTALPAADAVAAKPRLYCNLAVDSGYRRPDNEVQETALPGSTQDMHIKSADIATNATWLTAVVRPHAMRSTDPTEPYQGRVWGFGFTPKGSRYAVWWVEMDERDDTVELYRREDTVGGAGPVVTIHHEVTYVGSGRGIVDHGRGEIRMTVPLALLGDDGKPAGRRLYDLVGLVDQGVMDQAGSPVPESPYFRQFYFRHAVNSKKGVYYPLGAPSCVKPGPVR